MTKKELIKYININEDGNIEISIQDETIDLILTEDSKIRNQYNEGTIKWNQLNRGTIKESQYNEGTIEESQFNEGTIKWNQLNKGTIKSNQYNEGTIEENQYNEGTIEESQFNEGTIKWNQLNKGTIKSNQFNEGTIKSNQFNKGTIEESQINRGTINRSQYNEGTIEWNQLNRGTIKESQYNEGTIEESQFNEELGIGLYKGKQHKCVKLDEINSFIIEDKTKIINGVMVGAFKDSEGWFVATNGRISYHAFDSYKEAKKMLKEKIEIMINGVKDFVKECKRTNKISIKDFMEATRSCDPGTRRWLTKAGIEFNDDLSNIYDFDYAVKKFKEFPMSETAGILEVLEND